MTIDCAKDAAQHVSDASAMQLFRTRFFMPPIMQSRPVRPLSIGARPQSRTLRQESRVTPANTVARDVRNRLQAHQHHVALELRLQNLDDASHARLAACSKAIEIRLAYKDTPGPESKCLDDIGAAPETAVDEHFEAMLGREGETIPAGTRVGTMGNTGWSTGHHLHFEVRFDRNGDGFFSGGEVIANIYDRLMMYEPEDLTKLVGGVAESWEVSDDGTQLVRDFTGEKPRTIDYLAYPGNYGMIPSTFLDPEQGGDGGALDAIVLGPAVPRGSVVRARPIGVLRVIDRMEQDDKVVAILEGETLQADVADRARLLQALFACRNILLELIQGYLVTPPWGLAMPIGIPPERLVTQDLPHGLSGRLEKVGPILSA